MTKRKNLAEVAQDLEKNGATPGVVRKIMTVAEQRSYLRRMAGWPPEKTTTSSGSSSVAVDVPREDSSDA